MATHHNTGCRHAAKPDADKASSFIHARCTPAEKACWVRAANAKGQKLTAWITEQLNLAAPDAPP